MGCWSPPSARPSCARHRLPDEGLKPRQEVGVEPRVLRTPPSAAPAGVGEREVVRQVGLEGLDRRSQGLLALLREVVPLRVLADEEGEPQPVAEKTSETDGGDDGSVPLPDSPSLRAPQSAGSSSSSSGDKKDTFYGGGLRRRMGERSKKKS